MIHNFMILMVIFNFFMSITHINLEYCENTWANFKQGAFEAIFLGSKAQQGVSYF